MVDVLYRVAILFFCLSLSWTAGAEDESSTENTKELLKAINDQLYEIKQRQSQQEQNINEILSRIGRSQEKNMTIMDALDFIGSEVDRP